MTPLHIAAGVKDYSSFEKLLRLGSQWTARDNDGSMPLHIAASVGALDIVKHTIDLLKANVDEPGENGATALHFASKDGWLAVVEYLLEHGAGPNAISSDGSTPLHLAAYFQRKNIGMMLIDRGSELAAKTAVGWTPLHAAAAGDPEGRYETALVEYMIEKGADLEAVDNTGRKPRDYVQHTELRNLLSAGIAARCIRYFLVELLTRLIGSQKSWFQDLKDRFT